MTKEDAKEIVQNFVKKMAKRYFTSEQDEECRTVMIALDTLTDDELEPLAPWLGYNGEEYVWHCTECYSEIYHNGDSQDTDEAQKYALYCRHCGRKVNWECLQQKT